MTLQTENVPWEHWKDVAVPTKFHYQVSDMGRVRRIMPNGNRWILEQFYANRHRNFIVGMMDENGKHRKYLVCSLVAKTFIGDAPTEYQAVHKNGIKSDNRLTNIGYVKRCNIGKISNKSKKQTVFKIDETGDVVKIYPSAKECAKDNNFSYASIKRRASGSFKGIFATDGFAYCYEDNEKYLRKIERFIENGKK